MMFHSHPGDESHAECEVEKTFVRYSENDEGWRKGEEDYDQFMQIMVVWL